MVPEDVSAEIIITLEEVCLSQQTEVEEKKNDDDDKNSIVESFNQSHEKPPRSKVEPASDVLKNATLYSNKIDEMQSIIFKSEKLYCTEQLNSLNKKHITIF